MSGWKAELRLAGADGEEPEFKMKETHKSNDTVQNIHQQIISRC
jgi:hypothetical protein